MNKVERAVIVYGNDCVLHIHMKKWDKSTSSYIDFPMTDVTNLVVKLICSKHATHIPLEYTIDENDASVLICNIKYYLLHPNAAYGVYVEGDDEDDNHFRFEMLPSELFLVVSNTSGLKVTDNIEPMNIGANVYWGTDLTNYYTKQETETYVQTELESYYTKEEIQENYYDKDSIDSQLGDYYTKEEIQENYYDKDSIDNQLSGKQDVLVSGQNIKTINNQTLLGEGNIHIQEGSAMPFPNDWDINHTMQDLIDDINADNNATVGNVYLATVSISDLPSGLVQAEMQVEIMSEIPNLGKVILFTVTSDSVSPYHWEYTSTYGATGQWRYFVLNSQLATVATSGDYNDLSNKPTIPSLVQSDWNESDSSSYAYILNKPDLSQKQDVLVSGENIKTINNQSLLGSGNIDIQGGGGSYTAGDNIDITNNEISLKDDIEVHSITTEELYFKQYVSGQVNYFRWGDTPNRFLARNCLTPATEYQAGQEWYNLGQNYVLNIHNGDYSIVGTEWTADNNPPAWLPSGFGNDWYKSTTLVNGEPVYGIYNADTNSPDFYIYDADNFDWGNMIVDYIDLPLYKEDNPWNNHENGNTDLKNNEGNEFRGSNGVIIGNNNIARYTNNLLVGTGLRGNENTINIGYYNDYITEGHSLLSIGTGHKGLSVGANNTIFSGNTIEFDIEFPSNFTPDNNGRLEYALSGDGWWIWVNLYYDFDQQTGTTVNLYDTMNRGEWGDVDKYLVWTVYRASSKQYHITQTWWDDDQYTTAYNVFSTKTPDNVQYYNWEAEVRRTSFLHNIDGQTKIKAYDSDNLIDVAETLYNLNQNKADVNNLAPVATSGDYNDLSNKPTIPSLVQSDWNESDPTSYAYILNKPTIPSQVQPNWNESDPTSYAYILNKPTIPSLVQPNWNESDPTSYAYILNKPTIPIIPDPTTGNAGQYLATNGTNYVFRNQNSETLISTTSGSTQTKKMSTSYHNYLSMITNQYFTVLMTTDNTYQGEIKLRLYSDSSDTVGHTIYINGTVSSSTNYTLPKGTYTVYFDGTYYYFDTTGQIPFVPKSSVYNMKIEVVNALPATPDQNTIYLVL